MPFRVGVFVVVRFRRRIGLALSRQASNFRATDAVVQLVGFFVLTSLFQLGVLQTLAVTRARYLFCGVGSGLFLATHFFLFSREHF